MLLDIEAEIFVYKIVNVNNTEFLLLNRIILKKANRNFYLNMK